MKLMKFCKKMIVVILSVPKTIYINFKYLPISQAVKLPIFISYNTKIEEVKRSKISIHFQKIKLGLIRIGMTNGSFNKGGNSYLRLNGGEIHLKGRTSICGGCSIVLDEGYLEIGENFFANANLLLNCSNELVIGNDCLIGWNCTILDGNGHRVFSKSTENKKKSIILGNHIWITSNVAILNGTEISDNCIVAYGSVVHGKFDMENALISGNPATIIKGDMNWEH